ncbi:MAG: glycoside hydrolase family 97 catalytic domain-containing protein [Alistipes sp.]|nr:glycoside hydrolase family 97 catalytic domain-containing protein [Alistipes sp.]
MKRLLLILIATLLCFNANAKKHPAGVYVQSPDKTLGISLDWSEGHLEWCASTYRGPYDMPYIWVDWSRMNMETSVGVWGENVGKGKIEEYKKEGYNSAVVTFDGYAVELRAYNDGVAYRFISKTEGDYIVIDEVAEFAFYEEAMAWVPYVNFKPDATSDYATQFYTSFENAYDYVALKDIDWRRLIFTPAVVESNGLDVCIVESNLEDYPGMFLSNRDQDGTLDTEFAPVPDVVEQGDYNMLQGVVKSRKPYIAECSGKRTFPWRGVVIGGATDLANSRLVWNLADESRIKDTSWIKPGKVAWEWWNDWGLEGVDFKAGINNETYKYYIDFASRYGIEYVILDEGWSVKGEADLMKVVPEIDIKELVDYGKERGVGIILWAGYWAMQRDIDGLCKHYSEMGVKGWKVDFLDRDDQEMVRFVYDLAEIAAKYHMIVDYHGVYKPTGLQRTYPNAINFEGVHGLETMKWLGREHDQITYDVTIPFIRALAGPMDYTPGAMRNAQRDEYYPDYSRPMSQGTRCHQLAMYVVYNQPLAMLCDSPTAYEKEPEYTQFLAEIPTVWRRKDFYDGEIGEYIVGSAVAEDGSIYHAGLNGNTPRTVRVAGQPLDYAIERVDIYIDGPNAATDGSGYQHIELTAKEYIKNGGISIDMAAGGGFLVKITGHYIPLGSIKH